MKHSACKIAEFRQYISNIEVRNYHQSFFALYIINTLCTRPSAGKITGSGEDSHWDRSSKLNLWIKVIWKIPFLELMGICFQIELADRTCVCNSQVLCSKIIREKCTIGRICTCRFKEKLNSKDSLYKYIVVHEYTVTTDS